MNVTSMISPEMPVTGSAIEPVFARQQARAIQLRTSTADERIARLRKLQASIEAHRPAIYKALAADLHRAEAEADLAEVLPMISEIKHACSHLKSWMKPTRVGGTMAMLGTFAHVRYEPKGVSLIISPWNYPFGLTFGPLASAIAAGCTAIVKPSEMTPASSAVIAEIIRTTFDPADVAVFEGDASVATSLLDLPFDHMFFTGSPAVGKIVMASAAKHLSSVTLELGGKSPAIIDETADLDRAVKSLMFGKFCNNGQTCIAPDYLYVQQSVLPAFLDKAKAAITKMYGTDAAASPDLTRIVNGRHYDRVKRLLDDAQAKGATIVTGGTSNPADKYIAPTLLTNVAEDSAVMEEEIFGPLLPIISYNDVAGPIAAINAKPKPLALYMYSKDSQRTDRVIAETSSGGTCVNTSVVHFLHQNLPFGGVNNSGIGNAHGLYGFKAFSHERAVLRDRFSSTSMLFPPYTNRVKQLIKLTIKFFS
jgi:aldehyde dehydrogenase (NAD+)